MNYHKKQTINSSSSSGLIRLKSEAVRKSDFKIPYPQPVGSPSNKTNGPSSDNSPITPIKAKMNLL